MTPEDLISPNYRVYLAKLELPKDIVLNNCYLVNQLGDVVIQSLLVPSALRLCNWFPGKYVCGPAGKMGPA